MTKPSRDKCSCGHSLALERIVNGKDVLNPGTYPWQVILIVNGRFTCGGSLISPEFILTAGHCTHNAMAGNFEVVLGRHNFTQDYTEPHEQRRYVKRIIPHPNFDISILNYDIALLHLDRPVEITEYVSTVCLPDDPLEDYGEGTTAIATGWGSLSASSAERPQILQYIKVPTWNRDECGYFSQSQITENMLCAGGGATDACQGDSGGPLVTEKNDLFYLIGVTSWGKGCATPGYPGVYSRVTSSLTFIHQHLHGSTCF